MVSSLHLATSSHSSEVTSFFLPRIVTMNFLSRAFGQCRLTERSIQIFSSVSEALPKSRESRTAGQR